MLGTLKDIGRRTYVRLTVAALVVAVIGVAVAVEVMREPEPATPERSTPPIIVTAGRLGDGQVRQGEPVTLTGHALASAPIAKLELWSGMDLVETFERPGPSLAMHTTWEWVPDRPGPKIIFVRAVDVSGDVAQSNVVRLEVEAVEALFAPEFVLASTTRRQPEPFTSAPAPRVTVADCAATIDASSSAVGTGIGVFELAPSASAFVLGATLPSDGGRWSTAVSSGIHLFTLSSFDSASETLSAPVEVDVPDACSETGWTGDVRLVNGELVLPEPADRAYFYVTVDNGNARRVPQNPSSYIEPDDNGRLDATPFLPPGLVGDVDIEAWGWQQGTLRKMGSGSWQDPAPAPPGDMLAVGSLIGMGSSTSLSWVKEIPVLDTSPIEELLTEGTIDRPAQGSTAELLHTFRWSTSLPNVNSVAWQVFLYDAGISSDLDPPFALDSGVISVPTGTLSGDFTLKMGPYLGALAIPGASLANGPQQDAAAIVNTLLPGALPTPTTVEDAVNRTFTGVGIAGQSDGAPEPASAFAPSNLILPVVNDLWVRVVPVAAGTPMPSSNGVHFTIVEPTTYQINPDNSFTDRFGVEFTATLPVGADPKFARCAVVVKLTSDFNPSLGGVVYQHALQTGTPFCYHPPSGGWSVIDVFEAFVEFVADAWDFVSESWDSIKDLVVKTVLKVVPCDQFASAGTCEAIAQTALSAALVAAGIPPSLPDFDTAIATLKGDLTEAMIEMAGLEDACQAAAAASAAASSAGTSLPTCEQVADAALNQLTQQVEATQSKAAANAAGVSPPKGVVLAPDPRGIWHAPKITVKATRLSPEPLPANCYVTASINSTVLNHTWHELAKSPAGNWTWVSVNGDVSGQPFKSATLKLPDIPVGASITQDLYLVKGLKWWESDEARDWEEYLSWDNPIFNYSWTPAHTHVLLQKGAKLTYSVGGPCAVTATGEAILPTSGYGE